MKYSENTGAAVKSDFITWEARFEIGIPVIDGEHKTLVEHCNSLYKAVIAQGADSNDERKNYVRNVLRECAGYVQTHFKNEEKLMQLCNYADFQAHKAQHNEFTKMVLDKVKNFDSESYASSMEFVKFLYDWILSHIAHTDRLYVNDLKRYLQER